MSKQPMECSGASDDDDSYDHASSNDDDSCGDIERAMLSDCESDEDSFGSDDSLEESQSPEDIILNRYGSLKEKLVGVLAIKRDDNVLTQYNRLKYQLAHHYLCHMVHHPKLSEPDH